MMPPARWCSPVIVLVLSALTNSPSQKLFDPGEPPLRDRNADILHYALTLDLLNEQEKTLTATAAITLAPLVEHLDSVVLDAVDLDVRSVTRIERTRFPKGRKARSGVDSLVQVPLRFRNDSPLLVVYPDRDFTLDDTLTIRIAYSCTPAKGIYFLAPDSTNPARRHQIWTQGEDTDNRFWFPCYERPDDKATSEVTATVRDAYTVLSNGALVSESHDRKTHTRTFHWRQSKPQSSYLVVLAAGEYDILRHGTGRLPIESYVYRDRAADAQENFAQTADIVNVFGRLTGVPYPWEKYAQIVIADFMWGGMENTGAVTLNDVTLHDRRAALDYNSNGLLAHEIAHQWFGDLVTCRDWTHLWLNEGFANYYEALYTRESEGEDAFELAMRGETHAAMQTERTFGRKPVVSNDSYTGNVYAKGSIILHMLKGVMGERVFERAVKRYLDTYRYSTADTHDLQHVFEEVSGMNLDWFFTQWLMLAGYPRLDVSTEWDDNDSVLTLRVLQTQVRDSLTGVFRLPLDLFIRVADRDTMLRLWMEESTTTFPLKLQSSPVMVLVDPRQGLLKSMRAEKSREEWLTQLAHAPFVGARLEAVDGLEEYDDDEEVFSALRKSALEDSCWAVRRDAVSALGGMTMDERPAVLLAAARDPNATVRRTAVNALDCCGSDAIADSLEHRARTDSSYYVVGACIRVLAAIDSVRGVALAREFLPVESYRDGIRRAALGVLVRYRDSSAFRLAMPFTAAGVPDDIRGLALSVIRVNGEEDPAARAFVRGLAADPTVFMRRSAAQVLGQWGGDDAREVLENRKAVETDPGVLKALDDALGMVE